MIKANEPKRTNNDPNRIKRTPIEILDHAEGFISGFDDEDQIGIPTLLVELRELIAELKSPNGTVAIQPPPKRIYIDVSGGNIQAVVGTNDYEIIDWDNIEQDPTVFWQACDEETREYIKKTYPDDYQKYFMSIEDRIKSAAPDLLDAAVRVKEAIESTSRNALMAMGPQLQSAMMDLSVAIAKAKGQE
jgi:hypothetical protein